MDLALDEQQQALVTSVTDLLSKHASLEHVRAAEPLGFDPRLWQELLAIGIIEMAVPVAAGGWGASLLDLVLVAQQLGAVVAPAPVIEAQVSARILAGLPSPAVRATLGAVTSGSQIVTLALRPPDNGSVAMVPAGAVAHQALVLETDRLRIVTLTDANRRLVANLADAPIADVVIDESSELETGAGAAERFERAIDEWLVLCAGLLVGIASTAHRVTCAYARERHAWDTPIGSFQAVAHPLANGAVNIDGARLLTQKAAWELDRNGPRGRELVSTAFAFAAETARDVTYDAVHFHGGYGFTVESDLQLFYRRARGWARIWGEPAMGYQRAGDSRYLGEEGTGSRGL